VTRPYARAGRVYRWHCSCGADGGGVLSEHEAERLAMAHRLRKDAREVHDTGVTSTFEINALPAGWVK
jgi:hypothetical protein